MTNTTAVSEKRKSGANIAPVSKERKKSKRTVREGRVYVIATFNNTIITVTDPQGNVIAASSAAACGFKGSRKSTPFAAQAACDKAVKDAIQLCKLEEVHVKVKGPGPGRESAVRAVKAAGLIVTKIEDDTPIPFNGCKAPKRRRV